MLRRSLLFFNRGYDPTFFILEFCSTLYVPGYFQTLVISTLFSTQFSFVSSTRNFPCYSRLQCALRRTAPGACYKTTLFESTTVCTLCGGVWGEEGAGGREGWPALVERYRYTIVAKFPRRIPEIHRGNTPVVTAPSIRLRYRRGWGWDGLRV